MLGIQIFIVSLAGYLIGSVSFAVLICKRLGVNIFDVGSGNAGATNVKRVLGAKWGNTVFALDVLKGILAAGWPMVWMLWLSCGTADGADAMDPDFAKSVGLRLAIIGLVAAIFGHSYSIFLKFRGGKGVATTMGGLAAVMPPVLFIGLFVWIITYYKSRVVAIASILFALSLPISAYFFYSNQSSSDPRFVLAILLSILVILRHRSNITRLLSGQENSFKK
ncbi:MAG TPA: acyl-phosphate glycerol 3-phosphate acyltransferase [Opitutae bacterium]|nr:acyl-phosphate glycerol 3-phosphate acyltransferase [Coraliomargarita sp.]HBO57028.1 acyl-phosphate glycerol 3-phosphate acyltransferase [Opitutae bacterium]